jgi:mono/diheme cytochrome c family protein
MSKAWRSLGYGLAVGAFWVVAANAQAPAPAAPAAAAAAAAPAADGEALLQSNCTSCHDLSPIMAHGRTAQEWSDLVDRMVTYGASGSDTDIAAIKAYLAKTLPPGSTPTNAAGDPSTPAAPAPMTMPMPAAK